MKIDWDNPIETKGGWPARLLGKVNRPAFPYIVVVTNMYFGTDEVHAYGEDGRQPVDFSNHNDMELGALDGVMSLVAKQTATF